jgi:hypothetical protein
LCGGSWHRRAARQLRPPGGHRCAASDLVRLYWYTCPVQTRGRTRSPSRRRGWISMQAESSGKAAGKQRQKARLQHTQGRRLRAWRHPSKSRAGSMHSCMDHGRATDPEAGCTADDTRTAMRGDRHHVAMPPRRTQPGHMTGRLCTKGPASLPRTRVSNFTPAARPFRSPYPTAAKLKLRRHL